MSQVRKPNVLIIGNAHSHPSSEAFLLKFVRIIKAVANEVYVISGDKLPEDSKVKWLKVRYKIKKNSLGKITNQISIWQNMLLKTIKYAKKIDVAIVLPTSMVLPIIFLKIINKKTMVFAAQKVDNILWELFCQLSFTISDVIIVESEWVTKDLNCTKYKKKIVVGNIFVDTFFFKKEINIQERNNIIGYMGILDKRKGVDNLIKAIPKITERDSNNKFLIGGIGPLESIINDISKNNSNIKFKGFIPKEEVVKNFNAMKLFVLPSLSEGVPNVILEAMACGTPVLATPVGGIPNVIKDEETGFIMENNSPQCIADNIERALNYPKLDEISKNARKLIEKRFTYEAALKRYGKLLENWGGNLHP